MTNTRLWLVALLGAWLIISPWFFGVSAASVWNASICGLAIMFLAAWVLGEAHGVLPSRTRAAGDLRGNMPEMAVPDESAHMAGLSAHADSGPGIEAPDFHVQATGETTKG